MRGLNLASLLLVAVSGTNVLAHSSSVANTLDGTGLDKRSTLQRRMDNNNGDPLSGGNLFDDINSGGDLFGGGPSSPGSPSGCCNCFGGWGDGAKDFFCCGDGDDSDANLQTADTTTGGGTTTVYNEYIFIDNDTRRRYRYDASGNRVYYDDGYLYGREHCAGVSLTNGGTLGAPTSYGTMGNRPQRNRKDHDDHSRPNPSYQQYPNVPPHGAHPDYQYQQHPGVPPHGIPPGQKLQTFTPPHAPSYNAHGPNPQEAGALVQASGDDGIKPLSDKEREELDKTLNSNCWEFVTASAQFCSIYVDKAAKECNDWVAKQVNACKITIGEAARKCGKGLQKVGAVCETVNMAILGFCKPIGRGIVKGAQKCGDLAAALSNHCQVSAMIGFERRLHQVKQCRKHTRHACIAMCRGVHDGCKACGKAIGNKWQKAVNVMKNHKAYVQANVDRIKQNMSANLKAWTSVIKENIARVTAQVQESNRNMGQNNQNVAGSLPPAQGSASGPPRPGEVTGYPVPRPGQPPHGPTPRYPPDDRQLRHHYNEGEDEYEKRRNRGRSGGMRRS
ncbi:hypothetical protein PspLS_01593 [Pyricularia sp. CBS 133598]|nr:hypothetical protein PspLS_01593 [Pyricularia sp. CBS 133598]